MNDIKVPPFTDGQKQLIEMTEKLAEKRDGKICDVDDDITDIKELLEDTISRIEEPTNEDWFCSLSTEDKAKWLEDKMIWSAQEQGTLTAKGWEKWLKEKHTMANDITILSCPICNNPKLREYGNGIYQCDVCETYFDKDENIILTEQEYLQTCTTEQLAEFIIGQRKGCVYADCPNGETPCMSCKDGCDIGKLVEWLKQPHTTTKE